MFSNKKTKIPQAYIKFAEDNSGTIFKIIWAILKTFYGWRCISWMDKLLGEIVHVHVHKHTLDRMKARWEHDPKALAKAMNNFPVNDDTYVENRDYFIDKEFLHMFVYKYGPELLALPHAVTEADFKVEDTVELVDGTYSALQDRANLGLRAAVPKREFFHKLTEIKHFVRYTNGPFITFLKAQRELGHAKAYWTRGVPPPQAVAAVGMSASQPSTRLASEPLADLTNQQRPPAEPRQKKRQKVAAPTSSSSSSSSSSSAYVTAHPVTPAHPVVSYWPPLSNIHPKHKARLALFKD